MSHENEDEELDPELQQVINKLRQLYASVDPSRREALHDVIIDHLMKQGLSLELAKIVIKKLF